MTIFRFSLSTSYNETSGADTKYKKMQTGGADMKYKKIQAVLALHGNKVTAMNHLDSKLGVEPVLEEEFRFHEMLQRPVSPSFLLIHVIIF